MTKSKTTLTSVTTPEKWTSLIAPEISITGNTITIHLVEGKCPDAKWVHETLGKMLEIYEFECKAAGEVTANPPTAAFNGEGI